MRLRLPLPAAVATSAAPVAREGVRQPAVARLLPAMVLATAVLTGCQAAAPQAATPTRPAADPRFGVILNNATHFQHTLDLVGADWYLDYSFRVDDVPPGRQKALKVPFRDKPEVGALQRAAKARPGSAWVLSNEPNVPGQDDLSPALYADQFYRYANALREADPTAIIVGPETLNFDTTCSNCAGYPAGRAWIDEFRAAYRTKYGGEPPIDVWSLHTYSLSWDVLPQRDYATQARELAAFRSYLDALPDHRGKPIWLTEFSVIWGYEGVRWQTLNGEVKAAPTGSFRSDLLTADLTEMLAWLKANATALRLERWFIFSSHAYQEPWATQPAGIALVEGVGDPAQLTEFGDLYRKAALEAAR